MAERIKVGIIYENNENWIGGAYYIQNLIAALKSLPDSNLPCITILAPSEKDFELIRKINYPYISYKLLQYKNVPLNFWKRVVNKFSNLITQFDLFPQPIKLEIDDLDVVFPAPVGLISKGKQKNYYWIPDFQEQFLPHFFSKREIISRTQSHKFIAQSKGDVVFSSLDAKNTFNRLFPNSKVSKHILNFAVSHSNKYKELDLVEVMLKYGLEKPYFFAPNQFWKHKNQSVILKAVQLLHQKGIKDFIVAFSGKEFDYRNPEYVDNLKLFVKSNNLEQSVRFLGFIDRNDQLKLMSGAISVIQPSLFEGWSTVVEDAKAMDQWIIISDLPVHREQVVQNATFFNPEVPEELASHIKSILEFGVQKDPLSYYKQIENYGKSFYSIIDKKYKI